VIFKNYGKRTRNNNDKFDEKLKIVFNFQLYKNL